MAETSIPVIATTNAIIDGLILLQAFRKSQNKPSQHTSTTQTRRLSHTFKAKSRMWHSSGHMHENLLSTLPPSGPFSILPNPLHKPSRKKIPLASPIYPHVSLKRSSLNADDDIIVGLDLDSAYVRPWDLALYTDTTINNKEGTGIVTEKEEGIYTTALKAIVTIIMKVMKIINKRISHVPIITVLVTASLRGHTLVEDIYVSATTPPMKTTSWTGIRGYESPKIIQNPGSDVHQGDLVMRKGDRITSSGKNVSVFKKLLVALLSTGNKIQDLMGQLHPNHYLASTSPTSIHTHLQPIPIPIQIQILVSGLSQLHIVKSAAAQFLHHEMTKQAGLESDNEISIDESRPGNGEWGVRGGACWIQ
ncbi:hypothetical protein BDP27DRAFT_1369981 [Rhodocollybia butyracea]|uniref:Uncharacterized protein n=1 Tax=Rhodocollybia butyracea TaxID=206335 RepID=A0A9P5PE82_9AGAR|nr:hypothetical protein BDP27DRAFT_1369981 [Rhodocollybia butyracea]